MSVSLASLLSCGLDAAERAAEIIREVRSSHHMNVRFKQPSDPVTNADIRSERCITSLFRSQWCLSSSLLFVCDYFVLLGLL